jgi:hypothetical protein
MGVVYNKMVMMRILFLVMWIIPVLGSQAQGDIEIYANGHKYDSLEDYLESKKPVEVKSPPTQVSLNSQQQDDIRQEAQQLGIKVDINKIKTFQVNPKKLSDQALHRLYIRSIEDGVARALRDFYQTRGQPDSPMTRTLSIGRSITAEQLQEAIQQAVTASKGPKLLISEQGKVRIMSLTPQANK